MDLYFRHSNDDMEPVALDIPRERLVSTALADLERRNPDFVSCYQRVTEVNNGEIWIDVGSYTEFYVAVVNEASKEG